MEFRRLAEPDLKAALELVWKVFLEFEAPDYTPEGIEEFRRYIGLEPMREMLRKKELQMWGCFNPAGEVLGVIASRAPCHISLLFVHRDYHRRGIARALFDTMLTHYKENTGENVVTVNSSPYAADVYRRFGFEDTEGERTVNGIRYIPMKHVFR